VNDGRIDRPLDEDFQGYGQTETDDAGAYRFRTIRPVPYPGRTPHIHFAISAPGVPRFITQMYVAGEPLNERDGVLMSVRDPAARARLVVPLLPAAEPGTLAGTFDIVLS
jgi:protocatechuate 3,4-dioxygenase beta subunit